MTIASEIEKLNTNLTNSYTACQNKGANMPTSQNFDNLATCIASISGGGTSDTIVLNFGFSAASGTLTISMNNKSMDLNPYYLSNVGGKMLFPTDVEVSFYINYTTSDALQLYVNNSLVRSGYNFTYTFQSNSTARLEFNLGCCIPYYTLVDYYDGTKKKAENVKVGDKLLGYDINSSTLKEVEVLKIIKKIRGDLVSIKTENYEIEITPDHPILTNKGWAVYDTSYSNYEEISKIKLDSSLKLLTREHTYEQIISLTSEYLDNPIDVYTFDTTDGVDNYLASGLILHKHPCPI